MAAQLKQFEQHVLIYRDKTSQLPRSSGLNAICQAIKVHEQFRNTESPKNTPEGKTSTHPQADGTLEAVPQKDPPLNTSDIYRTLIEQQALLTRQVHKEIVALFQLILPLQPQNYQKKLSMRVEED